jgi:SWI/SNF-related matrix-associated actin-dependent regulator 1 of chromatin subfamily A
MLYEHQKTAIRNCINNPRYALYHEQGLGKTISAILSTDYALRTTKGNKHAIIVCPAFLQPNWMREINIWSKYADSYSIYSYEKFTGLPAAVQRCNILVIDEAHYIKNRKAKRTQSIVNAAIATPRVILLTGTPIGNRNILDIYTHLACLDPQNQFAKYSNFRQRFMKHKTHRFQPDTSCNEGEFLEIMSQFSERKLKTECLDLPDKIYYEFECKGTRVHQGWHVAHKMQAQEGFDFDIKDKSTGEVVDSVSSTSKKIELLNELIDSIPVNKQIVIYVSFRKTIEYLSSKKDLVFHGDLSSKAKDEVLSKFREGRARLLFATMQSMNVGVTLTNCSDVIYYSRTFSCTERAQSEDRFHRIGQRNIVNYYDIVASGVDRKAFEMIKQNKSYDEIKKGIENA